MVKESGARSATRVGMADAADRRAMLGLALLSILVVALVATTVIRESATLGYPVARVLFEDQFRSLGDGRLIPRGDETVTPAFAVIFMGPVFWIHQMAYYPLTDLVGSAWATAIERINLMIFYQLGTLMVFRLVRHGQGDRWVAVTIAATYALFPFMLSRLLICNSIAPAPFLLWSELGRLEGRPLVRRIGLILASLSYPLTGFSAAILAFQDYWRSRGPERRTTWRTLVAMGIVLAIVHFGVLVLWPRAQPSLAAEVVTFDDNLNYPVFPFAVSRLWAMPVKLFEIGVVMAGTCIHLFTNPRALIPAIVDFIYCAGTNKGIRDHTMVGSTIGLFVILGVRAGLYKGGNRRRNAWLAGGAAFALIYGHAASGPNGMIALALAPDPPRPHLEEVISCIPPGQQRCLALPALYPGFVGHCAEVPTYEPAELEHLRITDAATVAFVAPYRLDQTVKGKPYPPGTSARALNALATKIRAGELHAKACSPFMILVHSPSAGPNDPSTADLLEQAARASLEQAPRPL